MGDVRWRRTVIGAEAAHLQDFDGVIPEDSILAPGQRWSWTVSFSDPAGAEKALTHEQVLDGLARVVHGEHEGPEGPEGWFLLGVRNWFTQPSDTRRTQSLTASQRSRVCQFARYGRTDFPAEEEKSLFGREQDADGTPADADAPAE
ncbi:hypothetical protein OG711_08400 [Streptomyces uncialis]|uniref:hypothetical protein n=1 Tax=Streptomyces uncialis TaxID=1048205 RepID=UPI002E3350AB|nr:hypothetical protein [Streptomyces uncialis]